MLGDDSKIGTPTVILGTGAPTPGILGPANHNGGGMIIYNNQLYIGVGDTGANATPPQNKFGSCLNQANGKILRINLDGTIPTDNPLYNVTMATACSSTDRRIHDRAARQAHLCVGSSAIRFGFWIDPASRKPERCGSATSARPRARRSRSEKAINTMATLSKRARPTGARPFWPTSAWAWPPRVLAPRAVYDYPHANGNNCIIGGLIPDGCGWDATLEEPLLLRRLRQRQRVDHRRQRRAGPAS